MPSHIFLSDFHFFLWQFVVQQSLIPEHSLQHKDFESTGTMELLGTMNLLDTITKLLPFVKTIVLEFYSNLKKVVGDPTSPDFYKVYVRGHWFDFSPTILNAYLGCPDPEGPMLQDPIQEVVSGTPTENCLSGIPREMFLPLSYIRNSPFSTRLGSLIGYLVPISPI